MTDATEMTNAPDMPPRSLRGYAPGELQAMEDAVAKRGERPGHLDALERRVTDLLAFGPELANPLLTAKWLAIRVSRRRSRAPWRSPVHPSVRA